MDHLPDPNDIAEAAAKAASEPPPGPPVANRVQPAPVPMTIDISHTDGVEPPLVILSIATAAGVGVYFMPLDFAAEIANNIAAHARQARSGIIIANGLPNRAQRGDLVTVHEENCQPWQGVVLTVKPSKKSGAWVEVQRDDGTVWAMPERLVSA